MYANRALYYVNFARNISSDVSSDSSSSSRLRKSSSLFYSSLSGSTSSDLKDLRYCAIAKLIAYGY